jgi:hypothetical protein
MPPITNPTSGKKAAARPKLAAASLGANGSGKEVSKPQAAAKSRMKAEG